MTSLRCHYVTSGLCIVCDVTSSSESGQRYIYSYNIRKERILFNYFIIKQKIDKMRLNYCFFFRN